MDLLVQLWELIVRILDNVLIFREALNEHVLSLFDLINIFEARLLDAIIHITSVAIGNINPLWPS
jgi:hypothetical protein